MPIMVSQQQETHMTKITVKLSKNGFYFGTVEHTYSTADEPATPSSLP